MTRFWRVAPDGVTIVVKVQPKSRRPGLHGTAPTPDGQCLKLGVSEPAESGKANNAVCALLSQVLDVPRAAVTIQAGAGNRSKLIHVAGNADTLIARLETL